MPDISYRDIKPLVDFLRKQTGHRYYSPTLGLPQDVLNAIDKLAKEIESDGGMMLSESDKLAFQEKFQNLLIEFLCKDNLESNTIRDNIKFRREDIIEDLQREINNLEKYNDDHGRNVTDNAFLAFKNLVLDENFGNRIEEQQKQNSKKNSELKDVCANYQKALNEEIDTLNKEITKSKSSVIKIGIKKLEKKVTQLQEREKKVGGIIESIESAGSSNAQTRTSVKESLQNLINEPRANQSNFSLKVQHAFKKLVNYLSKDNLYRFSAREQKSMEAIEQRIAPSKPKH